MSLETPHRRPCRVRGFTLLEVLIAIALSLALGVTMFAFLQDLLATRSRTIEFAARQRAGATLIERLEADLATCVVGDESRGPGVAGDAHTLRLLARGVMTQAAARGLDDPAALADLHVTDYRFDPQRRVIEARKGPIDEAQPFATLGGPVAHLRFRYLDAGEWVERFDSLASNRLPQAVEVQLWYQPWPGLPEAGASDEAESPAPPPSSPSADADAGEAGMGRLPPADRRRVIVITDAMDDAAASTDAGGDDAAK